MAQTIPMIIALAIVLSNCRIFNTRPSTYNERTAPVAVQSVIASQFIKLAIYFLLLKIDIYHKSFRQVNSILQGLYEMCIGIFIIESVLICIWFPLERHLVWMLPGYLSHITNKSGCIPLHVTNICICNSTFMRGVIVGLSLMFLGMSLHTTRTVDFRLIGSEGIIYFFNNSLGRLSRVTARLIDFLWQRSGSRRKYVYGTKHCLCHVQPVKKRRYRHR